MTAPVYLGVDGGGTKTAFALIDATGSVVGREVLGGSYFVGDPRGIAALHEVLAAGVERLLGPIARTGLAAAFLGLPGFGESPGDVPLINAAVADVLPGVDFWCDNDMVSAWAGAFAGGDGIAVIGRHRSDGIRPLADRNGPGRRLGEVFGDEGSGYWIAVQGLNAWSRMSDGRRTPGPLLALLRDRLELADDTDLIDLVLNRWQGGRADIAALAPMIVAAADAGDDASSAILDRAGAELALLATTVRRRLAASDAAEVPVSYVGGVFRSPAVLGSFSAELRRIGGFDLRPPELKPDVGAAVHAAVLAGHPLSRAAVTSLHDNGR